MSLDPDDPRPPYVQVANALRAAIVSKALQPGEQLPSGNQLAKRYGVARMTVQQAIRVLRDEGLVVSRQGTGVFVRARAARPVALRPIMEHALQQQHASVDFFGFTGETLLGVIQEPLDKIRAGGPGPDSIAIRLLIPDTSQPLALPCRIEDLADDPEFRKRASASAQRHTQALTDAVIELEELGLIKNGSVQVRVHNLVPLFKFYILNRDDLFFGLYPVVPRRFPVNGTPHEIYDLMGKDTVLFHHGASAHDSSTGPQYLVETQRWFDTIWSTISRERAP